MSSLTKLFLAVIVLVTFVIVGLALLGGPRERLVSTSPNSGRPFPTSAPVEIPTPSNTSKHTIVRVLFGTDRAPAAGAGPGDIFGVGRGQLNYGYCDVSIPRDHRIGNLESPSIWRLEYYENPDKHVVLLSTTILAREQFLTSIARVAEKSAFVFVHGFNVSFEDAARRTAQISYDLGFKGIPAFYSWPSQNNPTSYVADEQTIEWSQAHLKTFLNDFLSHSDAEAVYLIAHSMGNRALTRAVASLVAENPSLGKRIKEIILTAPDIDAGVFSRDIAPNLLAAGRPITLYASSDDYALAASKKVHGYPRIGESGSGLVVTTGIETIDATGVDTSFIGHSYYGDNRSVLSDIYYLVREGHRADRRFGLNGVETPEGRYWKFKQ